MVLAGFLRQAWHRISGKAKRPVAEDDDVDVQPHCSTWNGQTGSPGVFAAAAPPPSKRLRASPAVAAENYVKGRSSWTISRHLLGKRRPNARTNRLLPPPVYPSTPDNAQSSYLSSISTSPLLTFLTPEPPSSQPPPLLDLTEDIEADKASDEDIVILSPPLPRYSAFPPTATTTRTQAVKPPDDLEVEVEMNEPLPQEQRTPVKDLIRSPLRSASSSRTSPPLTRSGSRAMRSPPTVQVEQTSSVDLAERERFRRVLQAQTEATDSGSKSSTSSSSAR